MIAAEKRRLSMQVRSSFGIPLPTFSATRAVPSPLRAIRACFCELDAAPSHANANYASDFGLDQVRGRNEKVGLDSGIPPTIAGKARKQPHERGSLMNLLLECGRTGLRIFVQLILVAAASPGWAQELPAYSLAHDAVVDSNPSGVWSYGWSRPASNDFTPFSRGETTPEGLAHWFSPGMRDEMPVMFRNDRTVDFVVGTFRAMPGELWLHPGHDDMGASVRWTAPHSGSVRLESVFRSIDTSGLAKRLVVMLGQIEIFSDGIPAGTITDLPLSTNLQVKLGDTLTFQVRDGEPPVWGDSVSATILIRYLGLEADVHAVPALQILAGGQTAVFSATTSSFSNPAYQWKHDGTNVIDDARVQGATTPRLTIHGVNSDDKGGYSIVVSEDSTTATSEIVRLEIFGPTDTLSEGFSHISNPHGAWSLGWVEPRAGGLSPFQLFPEFLVSAEGFHRWSEPSKPYGLPAVLRNPSSNSVELGTFHVQSGQIWAVPGVGGLLAAVKWTAPSTGNVRLRATFTIVDGVASSMGVSIRHRDAELQNLTILPGFGHSQSYARSFDVQAGDEVVFLVADGDSVVWGDNLATDISFSYGQPSPPVVIQQPQSLSDVEGANAEFAAEVSGPGPLSFHWQHDGVNLSDGSRVTGARTASLTIRQLQPSDGGDYVLVASNLDGEVRSSAAALFVQGPPYIHTQPLAYQSATVGSEPSLRVILSGAGQLRAQWQFNGSDLVGETNLTLRLPSIQPSQAGTYAIRLDNQYGVVYSRGSVVDVVGGQPPFSPALSLLEGFSAERNPNRNWALGWMQGHSSVAASFNAFTNFLSAPQGYERWSEPSKPFGLPGVLRNPSSKPIVESTFLADGGNVWAVPGTDGMVAAIRWSAPNSGNVLLDSTFTILDGVASSMVVNVRHGELLLHSLTIPAGFGQSRSLTTNLTVLAGDEIFFLVGDGNSIIWGDNLGLDIQFSYPNLRRPEISRHPLPQSVADGSNVSLSVEALGDEPFFYQWRKDGVDLADSPRVIGARTARLSLDATSLSDMGLYSVVVWNGGGQTVSDQAGLAVRESPRLLSHPSAFQAVGEGEEVRLSVSAIGEQPISCQWRLNGVDIAGATDFTLSLTNIQPAQAGTYTAHLTNPAGWADSDPAVVNVDDGIGGAVTFSNSSSSPVFDVDGTTPLVGPAFLAQLYAGTSNGEWAAVGAAVPFLAGAAPGAFYGGTRHLPSVTAGQPALLQVRVWESGTGTTYELAVANGSKFGASSVLSVLTGGAGEPPSPPASLTDLTSFALTTNPSPQIAEGPASATRLLGSEVTFQVSATGQPVLNYQWFFQGNPLAGAVGSSLTVAPVRAIDAGEYRVEVSNGVGTNTSAAATLEVRAGLLTSAGPHGQISVTPGGSSFVIGSEVELKAEPEAGFLFAAWSGDLAGDANPALLTLDTNKTVGATFLRGWTLTASGAAEGTVSRLPDRPLYPDGSIVVVTANPAPGFAFTGWTGDITTAENNLSVTLTSNVTVAASFRDAAPPSLTLQSPAAGNTADEQFTLSGTVADNLAVASARWEWNGAAMGALSIADGRFEVPGLRLRAGENRFRALARDAAGNEGMVEVLATWVPSRTLILGTAGEYREGLRVEIPVELTSEGDVAGMSFVLRYDAAVLGAPEWTWSSVLDTSIKTVNAGTPGEIRVTFSLPATVLPAGRQSLALLSLRARSVPANTESPLTPELLDVADPLGNRLTTGTHAKEGKVTVLPRRILGDNNANDRLDIGDATLIQRLVTGLDQARAWDVWGNDLNTSGNLDSGDVIRVLRAVVGLDAQPTPLVSTGPKGLRETFKPGRMKSGPQPVLANVLVLSPNGARVEAGQRVTVQVSLQNLSFAASGASFTLTYPTNALRLVNAQSHQAGTLVPFGSVVVWNVAPAQSDFVLQSGRVSFAAISATPWTTSHGVLAQLSFEVQSGASVNHRWPIQIALAEVTRDGYENYGLTEAGMYVIGRDPVPAVFDKAAATLTGEGFRLVLAGENGVAYGIVVSTDLRTWTSLATVTCQEGRVVFTDPAAVGPGASQRFYRAILLP